MIGVWRRKPTEHETETERSSEGMAQSGVDERAGSGSFQQPAALAPCPARAGLGAGFGFVGRAGRGGGPAATMVPKILPLFRKRGFPAQSVGRMGCPGTPFFHRRHATRAGVADVGQRPVGPAPPVWRSELLVRCQEEILVGPAVLDIVGTHGAKQYAPRGVDDRLFACDGFSATHRDDSPMKHVTHSLQVRQMNVTIQGYSAACTNAIGRRTFEMSTG